MSENLVQTNHHRSQGRRSLDRWSQLKNELEALDLEFESKNQIQHDPVSLVKAFDRPEDQEVAAFIASCFAWGRVEMIKKALNQIFGFLGPRPAQTLKEKNPAYWKDFFGKRRFVYRRNTERDLIYLFGWLGEALRQSGNLEGFFQTKGLPNSKALRETEDWLAKSLESFVTRLTSLPLGPSRSKIPSSTLFLLPNPNKGSACKRMALFLRWVVGTTSRDLGLWKSIPKSELIIPLDTHVLRISNNLGLTRRKTGDWIAAREITRALKHLDPVDPVRFDFALAHLGISQRCPSRVAPKICRQCGMNSHCQTYLKQRKP